MPKPLRKVIRYEFKMTEDEHKRITKLTLLNKKKNMAEYILEAALNYKKENEVDLHFQKQQLRSMHLLIQFVMYIASFSKSKEEVLRFYESAYSEAIKEFGKEDN